MSFSDQDIGALVARAASVLRPAFGSALVTAVFAAVNRPVEAGRTLQYTLAHQAATAATGETRQDVELVQCTREALLKAAPLCGFPRVINAIHRCVAVVDPLLLAELPVRSSRAGTSSQEMEERGHAFFSQVYSHHTGKILSALKKGYPDLADVIIQDMYGRVLSDPRWINALETELLAIGTLAVLDVPAQLRGHIGGARNVGATDTQIDTVLEIANTILTQTK